MAAGYTKGARMTDTDSGWRKRQIALDKKAENARELGLYYEPDKTIEMARESHMDVYGLGKDHDKFVVVLEAFAKLVAAKEREACAKVCEELDKADDTVYRELSDGGVCAAAIRARGQA